MPHQLIYTSAPRGLQAGRSGYCTVARSRDLRERLILPIEQYSNYTHLVLPGQEATVRNPIIHLYRKHAISGKEYRILSRIVDAGADHTGRSNFVAHHLIFEDDWRGLPSPAVILRYWLGWKDLWNGDPTYIDEISPDEFRTLGQAEGIPAAANDAYLAIGWDTPFTTYLQDGDSQADFEWMGTRDDPDPGKKIAALFGSGPEEQSKTLEKIPGVISVPDGDETRLLDVVVYALGRRSQAAEQEALGHAREALEAEHEKIERLARQIEASIGETKGKVDAYRQQYEEHAASRLYQNCLADYIKPAERRTESAKAKSQDIIEKAQAEHQAAKSQLESGQSPATGINPGYQNDLREIAKDLAETNHELTGGIQKFDDELNEQNRAENLRLTKEREERLKEQKIRHTHRGTPVGTEADFAGAYRGARSAKSKRWVLPVVIISVLVLMIAVSALNWIFTNPANPILYVGKETNNNSRHRSYHVNKGSTDTFLAFNDIINILYDKALTNKWSSIKPGKHPRNAGAHRLNVELIKNTYVKDLTIIEKSNNNYFITIAQSDKELVPLKILIFKDEAAGAVKTLMELHKEKFFSDDDKTTMSNTYTKVKVLYCKEKEGVQKEPQEEDNDSLRELKGFRFVIDGVTEEKQLEAWNEVYRKAKYLVDSGSELEPKEKAVKLAEIEKELNKWKELVINSVTTEAGGLDVDYQNTDEIKEFETINEINEWLVKLKMWKANIKKLGVDEWKFPEVFDVGEVRKAIDDNFKSFMLPKDEVGPDDFEKLLDDQKAKIRERAANENFRKRYEGRYLTMRWNEIIDMEGKPDRTKPEDKFNRFSKKPILRNDKKRISFFYDKGGGKELALHFFYDAIIEDYRVDRVEFK